jgi:hypothetical protein
MHIIERMAGSQLRELVDTQAMIVPLTVDQYHGQRLDILAATLLP